MHKISFILIFIALSFTCFSQEKPSQNKKIYSVLSTFFKAMGNSDTSGLRPIFVEDCALTTVSERENKTIISKEVGIQKMLQSIAIAQRGTLKETIENVDIRVDGAFGTAWMDYSFYFKGTFSHCGINQFNFVKIDQQWKIHSITDTRRKEACNISRDSTIQRIEALATAWHLAAATADEDTFFGRIDDEGVYIGTDPEERWTKAVFEAWAMPHFQKESAWAFTATSRNITLSEDGRTAWMDELLDTWMGPCRGSAVWKKTDDGVWKIALYHLAVSVPNDVIQAYLKLIQVKK